MKTKLLVLALLLSSFSKLHAWADADIWFFATSTYENGGAMSGGLHYYNENISPTAGFLTIELSGTATPNVNYEVWAYTSTFSTSLTKLPVTNLGGGKYSVQPFARTSGSPIEVRPIDDAVFNANRTIQMKITYPVYIYYGNDTANLTIINND